MTHAEHVATFGALPRLRCRVGHPDHEMIALARKANLTGRGGAAFPVATKLAAVAQDPGGWVIVNGCDGEPASAKDTLLLMRNPHLVIDGAVVAAAAVGAARIVIAIDRGRADIDRALMVAISERDGAEPAIDVADAPARYVASEATALVRWLNGGPAKPTFRSPPHLHGVGRSAALVQNAETLAHLGLIARYGAKWFTSLGTKTETGTALVTFGGAFTRPGVTEVPLGTPLEAVLDAGGGVSGSVDALLMGGYGGTWVAQQAVPQLLFSNGSLSRVGASVGSGVIAALPAHRCGLAETARVVGWLATESAGQCGPCVFGLPAIAAVLDDLVRGHARPRDIDDLHRWTNEIPGRGACHHPDGAARLAASALGVFATDVAEHLAGRPCSGVASQPVLPIPNHQREPWK
jgi:NADH:ubiquinone oxidoreductase subunit F (NADH-binding)